MKRVRKALVVLGALVAVGTIGYQILEDMTILDALYMTVTTVSTVGFGEVHPLSRIGRVFTIGLILFGVGTMAWAAENMVEALLEDHVHHAWWRRRMEHVIDRLSDHYIVCGYGRMGEQIGRELTRRALAFVVIEREPTVLEMLRVNNVLHIEGDATSDSALLTASEFVGKTLRDSRLRERWDAIVVAIKHQGVSLSLVPRLIQSYAMGIS